MRSMSDNVGYTDVLKTGTKVLTEKLSDDVRVFKPEVFEAIGAELSEDRNVVLVTSAGIVAGMIATGATVRPDRKTDMPELQRFANNGWHHLLNRWDEATTKTLG